MDTLAAIGRWLSKQHVVTWCVSREDELWCANAFYVYDPDTVAFYLLSEEHTRHGQMTGQRAKVAGTVNGQPKTVALIRGVQFKGEIRRLSGDEEARMRQRYVKRFRWPHAVGAGMGDSSGRNQIYRQHAGFREKLHWRRDAGAEQA
ncbi:yhbP [Klebsiella pneumoniae]|uniref:YhbP n=1 Tax=Klebsiella pneumoniae TaxID=573 RepID=A0A377U5V5_KLEPN|nr:yhbP [Klebsiella pneumoniae]